ncbi:hypothetical protein RhiirA4_486481 [Rhizophagus irregularis]|uniref:Uncharacterized protein n=1 Tax=Rhizophagus irregularis TaxID=588596 RepID=A0A2I1HRE2_9GLOM|nr:hypothetical protein RhiirA4_486481 [Rhizophagus irregularis]
MINLHAATSLAEDLSFDLVDIYGIHKWEAMKASPLNDPDIVAEMVRNLPVEEFGKYLLLNRTWYAWCRNELWKWHKKAEEAYDRVANICKKAERAYWRDCADGGINLDKLIAEAGYDRAAEKWEKANDALGQLYEEEGIGNCELHELKWKAYQKACEERKEARKEYMMVRQAFLRCGLQQ